MPRVPRLKPDRIVRALRRGGFVFDRQKGGHVTLRHPHRRCTAAVPEGPHDLPPGTLRAILRQAGLAVDEFLDLLK